MHSREAAPARYSMVMYLGGYCMLALAAIHSIGVIDVIGVAESGVFTGWHSIFCIGGYLAYYFIRFGFRLGINSIEFGWVYLVRDLGLFIVALPHLITTFAAIHLITPSINFRL
jgi:hypothetical protein